MRRGYAVLGLLLICASGHAAVVDPVAPAHKSSFDGRFGMNGWSASCNRDRLGFKLCRAYKQNGNGGLTINVTRKADRLNENAPPEIKLEMLSAGEGCGSKGSSVDSASTQLPIHLTDFQKLIDEAASRLPESCASPDFETSFVFEAHDLILLLTSFSGPY